MYEPDPATIRAAVRGDTRAFEELMRAYQVHVWRFLSHMLRDPGLAEDVTQEAFIRVYRKLHTFAFRSKFSTWIFQIARNAGIDAIRARQRRAVPTDQPPHEAIHPTAQLRLEVEEALESLTIELREAFLLIELFGFTYRDAGWALGIPEGTVKSRVHRARQELVRAISLPEDRDDP